MNPQGEEKKSDDVNAGSAAKLSFSQITFLDPTCLHGKDKESVYNAASDLLTLKGVPKEDHKNAFMLVMVSLAILSTSKKSTPKPDAVMVQGELSGKPFSITYKEFATLINSLPQLASKHNKDRIFARTFADEYLEFIRDNMRLFPAISRANKHGIPAEFAYLAADFIQTSEKLSEHEQIVLLEARRNATHTTQTNTGEVTNLNHLSRRPVI